MKQNEFYCVACGKRVSCHGEDIRVRNDRNGKPRMVSKDKHGHKLFKYIKYADESALKRKYN
jgi:hypothetical protein